MYRCILQAASPYYFNLLRSIICFDATPIADTDTIDSATLSLYGFLKQDGLGKLPTTDIYTSTPASTSNLVIADYSQTGNVSQTGAPITYANFTVGAFNNYAFNATGIANISKTAISKFAWKNANYDAG